jgi:hypothetical protein
MTATSISRALIRHGRLTKPSDRCAAPARTAPISRALAPRTGPRRSWVVLTDRAGSMATLPLIMVRPPVQTWSHHVLSPECRLHLPLEDYCGRWQVCTITRTVVSRLSLLLAAFGLWSLARVDAGATQRQTGATQDEHTERA